nr:selenoneine biosynthesis selenosugar synthase SenB [Rhodoferax sp.]
MTKPRVLIISPAATGSNNGNWQTAWRWSRMLHPHYDTTIAQDWAGEPFDVMLALHARRSAEAIAYWARARGVDADCPGLAVVLTGTDLYRDIQTDASAQASLAYAQRLVVLQDCAPQALPRPLRAKARVIFQSVTARKPVAKTLRHVRAVVVGHLRDEKSPRTVFAAARLLKHAPGVFIDHIGEALDHALGQEAQACAAECPQYRWLGGLPHAATRRRIQSAHVLVHPSRMEGGAHVVMEAVCSGTPVLASRIDGNIGMLGADYSGYFALGDAHGLADALLRFRAQEPGAVSMACAFYQHLQSQCNQRAPWFTPANEQSALHQLVRELLQPHPFNEIRHQHASA